ncbi:MAG: hypothetical protein H0Z33_09615 [Bacillaceae bacterium]|nr:hypothetical protein [Bacillaceae bacterium]
MNNNGSIMDQLNLVASLSDVKHDLYQNTLLLTTLIDVLAEKNIIEQQQLVDKMARLESQLDQSLKQLEKMTAQLTQK